MTCTERIDRLSAFVDGELDAADRSELETHLAFCAWCSGELEKLRALSSSIRRNASRPAPDADGMRRLAESLRGRTPSRSRTLASFVRYVLVAAAAGVLAWLAAAWWTRPASESRIAAAIVDAHVRSLLADHLTDVASSDRHTVNPWFQGKVDFAVGAHDHAEQGFALAGGRLDYVDGRTVAAAVYRHGPHALNLFEWPAASGGSSSPTEIRERGYEIAHWNSGGIERWLVSDADRATVRALADLVRADG